MKGPLSKLIYILFRKELELRVKIFHVLAMSGVLICVSVTAVSAIQGMYVSMAINAGTGLLSLILLIYSARGGRQELCYWASIVSIFLVLFPSLFLFGGGYRSGMVFFFVFAVVFTVYMLDGWKVLAVTVFELCYYSGFCIYAYLHPEAITQFATELDVLVDVIVGFCVVSISLGVTMFVQFQLYQRQNRELSAARAEAEIASQAKSSFLANMSHEIRTPIHVIMSLNALMEQEAPNERMRGYAEKIRSTGEALRGLVDRILDMSKIEAGKMELQEAPYRTAELMQVLELTGQNRCQAKGLQFRCVQKDLPPALYGDMPHIRQICINLLNNAAKYTEMGCVTLLVSCTEAEEALMLTIAVTDTGVGIRNEDIPKLFEAFSRADQPGNRYIEGTGLGLAIVRELCRLMGGSIRVESKPGWGSTFTVRLPQRPAALEDVAVVRQKRTFAAPLARVLVVDDNPDNLMVVRELLRRTKMQVDTVSSGRAALEAVRRNAYHAILLDYMMPQMDGIETMRRLSALPDFRIPVIALTANVVAGTGERLKEAGFAEYLTKPISWDRLEGTLMAHLPRELVTVLEEADDPSAGGFWSEAKPLVQGYPIDLREAGSYLNEREFLQAARIFLSRGEEEQRTLGRFQGEGLLYAAHALKGRARNLGLVPLAEEAARIERLCREGQFDEAGSLIAHLCYLYGRSMEGLEKLRPWMEEELADAPGSWEALGEYLEDWQRGPALQTIDRLLSELPEQRGALQAMREAVAGIRFEEALGILERLKGGV